MPFEAGALEEACYTSYQTGSYNYKRWGGQTIPSISISIMRAFIAVTIFRIMVLFVLVFADFEVI